MNTLMVVFVLLTYVSGSWVPTLEFSTKEKCEVAAKEIQNQRTLGIFQNDRYKCIRIEK
jgi:hypothetical protein